MKTITIDNFSEKSKEELVYYVYALVDPRDKKIFYIGKGCGDRVFSHSKAALNEDDESLKLDLIREIMGSGNEVKHYILRHKLTEHESYLVESVLIDLLTYCDFNRENLLTNVVSGHHQWDEGIKTVEEIELLYNCEKINVNPNHHILLVSLNRTFDKARDKGNSVDIYDITRGNWVIAQNKADKIDFVLGVYRGIVRSVIDVANHEHKWITDNGKKKCRFEGVLLIDSPYLNKDVTKYPFGSGGAIRYINL